MKIAVDVHLPEYFPGGNEYPAILEMPRYWRRRGGSLSYPILRSAARGSAYVVMDERGTELLRKLAISPVRPGSGRCQAGGRLDRRPGLVQWTGGSHRRLLPGASKPAAGSGRSPGPKSHRSPIRYLRPLRGAHLSRGGFQRNLHCRDGVTWSSRWTGTPPWSTRARLLLRACSNRSRGRTPRSGRSGTCRKLERLRCGRGPHLPERTRHAGIDPRRPEYPSAKRRSRVVRCSGLPLGKLDGWRNSRRRNPAVHGDLRSSTGNYRSLDSRALGKRQPLRSTGNPSLPRGRKTVGGGHELLRRYSEEG